MEKEYNIKLPEGTIVLVTEEVYRAYKRPQWREAKQKKVYQEREVPFDEFENIHMTSDEKLVEQIVEDKLLLEMLLKALETLTEDERFLIDEIYFHNKSENEIAMVKKVTKQAINKKKQKILNKIRKILKF